MKTLACIQVLSAFAVSFAALSSPVYAREVSQAKLATQVQSKASLYHHTANGTAVPLVCNPDDNSLASANFVSLQHQFTLQLNGAGDANDIEGAFIDGFAGEPLQSVQIDLKGQCLPPNSSVVPEGPNISVIGNDAYGNGVLAVANCTVPSSATVLTNGFTRETFGNEVFETVQSTGATLNQIVKIIGLDIEVSGLSEPLYMRNIRVNNHDVAFDLKPQDQVGCLDIYSPF